MVDISCSLPPTKHVIQHAQLAESLGYKRIWLFDTPALHLDVWACLAAAATHTTSIGLGVSALVPHTRHVIVNAAAIATIEALAPGRLICAIGTGYTARKAMGDKPLAWKYVSQYLSDLRTLLLGGAIDAGGKTLHLSLARNAAPDFPIETPIIVAADGPKGLKVAREQGDGVVSVLEPTPGSDWGINIKLEMGTVLEEGESFTSPRVFDALAPAIAGLYHGRYDADRELVETFPNGKAWCEAFDQIPQAVRHAHLWEGHMYNIPAIDEPFITPDVLASEVIQAALRQMTNTGTRQQIRDRFLKLKDMGVNEILYLPMGLEIEREMRVMREVAYSASNSNF